MDKLPKNFPKSTKKKIELIDFLLKKCSLVDRKKILRKFKGYRDVDVDDKYLNRIIAYVGKKALKGEKLQVVAKRIPSRKRRKTVG